MKKIEVLKLNMVEFAEIIKNLKQQGYDLKEIEKLIK